MFKKSVIGKYEITKSYKIRAKDVIRLLPDSITYSILDHFGLTQEQLKDASIYLTHGYDADGESFIDFHYSYFDDSEG